MASAPLGHLGAADAAGTRNARAHEFNRTYGTDHDLNRGQHVEIPIPFDAPGRAHEDRRVAELEEMAEEGRLPASNSTGTGDDMAAGRDAQRRHIPRAQDPWAALARAIFPPEPPSGPVKGGGRHGG